MPVAPSFQKYEMISTEPYEVSGRLYVRVRHPNTRNERQVRWYNDKEYSKLYPEIPVANEVEHTYIRPQKDVLGCDKGYITIFRGDDEVHAEWYRMSNARYARWWGWYIVSTEEIPADLPSTLTPVQLMWDAVGDTNGRLKPESAIKIAVDNLLYEDDGSQFIGSIGERIEKKFKITQIITLENGFGHSSMYLFDDEEGNHYTWTTSVKIPFPEEKDWHIIRGTIKDHRMYKNQKQTVLIRCKEVR